jgi:PAS domain S-box-containing protein
MFALKEPEPESVMVEATRLIAEVLHVELSSVLETAPTGGRFLRRAWFGFRAPPPPAISAQAAGLGAYTMAVKVPVVVDDLGRETRFECPPLADEGVVSALCVVIHAPAEHGVVYGCLFAGSREGRAFDRCDVDFLEAVSNILGSVIYRRRTEEALRKSEERFELLSAAMRDGALLALAPEGSIARWNAPAERLFGWRAEEVIGKHVSSLCAEEDAFRGVLDALLRRAAHEGQVDAEAWLVRSDGTRFRAAIVVLALRGERDGTRGSALIVRDVTARFEAEAERARLTAEIEQQRDTLQAVIEQFPAGVLLADARDGRINMVSRHMTTIWRREFDPDGFHRGHSAEYPAWFPDGRRLRDDDYGLARALQGETVRQEIVYERRDGTRCMLIDTAAPLYDRRGRVIGGVAAVYDISAEKAMAQERERLLEEAKRAVRVRDDILAVVSHDLRNPAGVVALAASQLAQRADALDPATVRKLAGRIHRAASGMQQIIGDLLDFSRIEMGRLVVEPSDQSAGEVVAEAIDAFVGLAAQRGVEMRARLEALEGVRLRCDRGRIVQVLSNLIGNALKFVAPGRGVEIGGRADDHDLVVFVRDEGPGISAEHLSHVFDRYWQSDATDARRGLGLGLAIVKGIVEAHGGRAWVESPPGQGATFAFSLPLTAND